MIRLLLTACSVSCVAVVLAEGAGLAYLWSRGQLKADTINGVRAVLVGSEETTPPAPQELDEPLQPSIDQIIAARADRVLDWQRRENELVQLKTLVAASREAVSQQVDAFEKRRQEFQDELTKQQQRLASEATAQSREILLKSQPAIAVQNLMGLTLEENINLIQGMPEKKIADLLQEFSNGQVEQIERGRKIFEALARGGPAKQVVDRTEQDLNLSDTKPESKGGRSS